jgi:hypothetical protein
VTLRETAQDVGRVSLRLLSNPLAGKVNILLLPLLLIARWWPPPRELALSTAELIGIPIDFAL